jgi:hypothetical protein
LSRDTTCQASTPLRSIRALRATLRTLHLDRLLGAETKIHLLDIIANFAETLEQLTVNMVYFGHYAGSGERPTFVHLRTIALEHSVLDLRTFEAAFPLLEDLKVKDGEDEFDFDDDPLAIQHAASNRDHRCATWTRLRFLSEDQNSLLGLGLSRHAPSVGLFNYGIVLDSEDDGRQLAIILTGMRVEMLTLSISPCIDWLCRGSGRDARGYPDFGFDSHDAYAIVQSTFDFTAPGPPLLYLPASAENWAGHSA